MSQFPERYGNMLDEQLQEYWEYLALTRLSDNSIRDYYYFAWCFVRWVHGDFDPGHTLDK